MEYLIYAACGISIALGALGVLSLCATAKRGDKQLEDEKRRAAAIGKEGQNEKTHND